MTKKDYILIAGALHDALDDHQRAGRSAQGEGILDAAVVLSRRLHDANSGMDQAKFLLACGMPFHARVLEDIRRKR